MDWSYVRDVVRVVNTGCLAQIPLAPGAPAMRSFQEFKGQISRLDYDRERGDFVARPAPHPFVFRNVASEVRTEVKKPENFYIAASSWPSARADKVPKFIAPDRLPATSDNSMEVQRERGKALTGHEDSMWSSAVVGLALAGIVIWIGFVVS